jgi:enoyl-CoA hydratase/carnithine racemase
MADYNEILYEKQRNGVLITLNRPEAMNAISRSLIKELHQALDEVESDPEIRAVVITGAGRAFSAGMDQGKTASGRRRDLHWPYGIPTDMPAAEAINSWRSESRNFMRLWEFPKPIIGAINGWAMGAGSWLALFAHITIASENAVFAQPEVRHGSNTSFMWTLLGGFKNSLRYGLTGDHIDAQEALRIGLVVKVVPADQLLDECFSLVERVARVPPETVKINLQITTMGLQMMGLRMSCCARSFAARWMKLASMKAPKNISCSGTGRFSRNRSARERRSGRGNRPADPTTNQYWQEIT